MRCLDAPIELGERCEDSEDHSAGGGGGVDVGALAGEDFEPDAAAVEVLGDLDEMAEAATEAIELPDDQGVAFA